MRKKPERNWNSNKQKEKIVIKKYKWIFLGKENLVKKK